MIYGFAPNYNAHIKNGEFDLAANLLNQVNLLSIDSLTGLRKRDFIDRKLESLVLDTYSDMSDFSYVMCDLDKFKEVNDTYGHKVGDETLNVFGKIVLDNLRPLDVAFRYGGEEFSIILPNTDLNGAVNFSERLRENIEKRLAIGHYGLRKTTAYDLGLIEFNEASHDGLENEIFNFFNQKNITCSFGVSSYNNSSNDIEILKELADKALYDAKDLGRNKVMSKTYVD